jgi:phosphatidylglycerol---prolipoprotein diacylglyceryl transferase
VIHWHPNPLMLELGPLQIRWYGMCFLTGFLLGYQVLKWMCKKEGKSFDVLDPLLTYLILGTIIGARLGHCLFYDPSYYLTHPVEILKVWEGGLASHGGTVGVFVALWLFSKRQQTFSLSWLFDHVTVPVALIAALIRFGNLMNSEIIGKPTSMPWSFIFDRVDQIPRHPAQLYESFTYLALFAFLMILYKRNPFRPSGLLFGISMIVIFGSRIVWEFFKENQEPFEAGMVMNMGQILSIPFVVLGAVLVYRAVRAPKPW